mgnify:CR=1 FL=1
MAFGQGLSDVNARQPPANTPKSEISTISSDSSLLRSTTASTRKSIYSSDSPPRSITSERRRTIGKNFEEINRYNAAIFSLKNRIHRTDDSDELESLHSQVIELENKVLLERNQPASISLDEHKQKLTKEIERNKKKQQELEKELTNVQNAMHKQVNVIRKQLSEQLQILDNVATEIEQPTSDSYEYLFKDFSDKKSTPLQMSTPQMSTPQMSTPQMSTPQVPARNLPSRKSTPDQNTTKNNEYSYLFDDFAG